jgi:aspartate ammonia-lyase
MKYFFYYYKQSLIFAKLELLKESIGKYRVISGVGHKNFEEIGNIVYPQKHNIYNSLKDIIKKIFKVE